MNIYLEKLDFSSLLFILKISFSKKINNIFFFSIKNHFYFICIKLFSHFKRYNYKKIKISHLGHKIKNESLSSCLFTDLIVKFQNNIKKDKIFLLNKEKYYLSNFIRKSLTMGHFYDGINDSPYTLMFIFKILTTQPSSNNSIILGDRSFKDAYREIFKSYDTKIIFNKNYLLFLNIYNYSFFINFIIKTNYFIFKLFLSKNKKIKNSNYFIYNDDLISTNLDKNEKINDFAFQVYSNLDSKYISYNFVNHTFVNTKFNKAIMNKYSNKYILSFYPNFKFLGSFKPSTEKNKYNRIISKYISLKNQWVNFFVKNNIKVYLTWYKFQPDNVAINSAINEINGISCIWQRSFEAYDNPHNQLVTDIYFSSSIEHSLSHTNTDHLIKNEICVGTLNDYNKDFIEKKAIAIKSKLRSNGAETIICMFDQNSKEEMQNIYQKKNYEIMLNEILKNPKLGLILKPKKIYTLFERLGYDIKMLLDQAIRTGRCHIFDSGTKIASNVLVSLGALSSDFIISTNLSAGSSAVESAILGKKTLLLDSESFPNACFYNKGFNSENIVFNNIQDILKEINNYINSDKKNKEFGNWENHISYFDPYRDGKSQMRMGNYLNDLIVNINLGINREESIELANINFKNKWGKNKLYVR